MEAMNRLKISVGWLVNLPMGIAATQAKFYSPLLTSPPDLYLQRWLLLLLPLLLAQSPTRCLQSPSRLKIKTFPQQTQKGEQPSPHPSHESNAEFRTPLLKNQDVHS